MLEIEIKARVDSIEHLEDEIIKKGGVFKKEVLEEDVYFNHPKRDFKKTDEALRLRKTEGKYFLTYKGPKIDKITKTREELTIMVSDWFTAIAMLKALGFDEVGEIKKKRRYLQLKEYDIMLDSVQGLGSFIEVEKHGEYNPDELIGFLKSHGIKGSETRSYLEMMLE